MSDADLKRFPVEAVSWDEAQLFLGQLNKREKQEGWVYRLPKEVEWEYACRDGPMADKLDSAFDFYFDKPVVQLQADQANFEHGKGLKRRARSAATSRTGWVCTICTAMSGSGATTYTTQRTR